MAAGLNNCQVIEAIQNLPPELREIIYKHYIAIKLREGAASCYSVCSLYALLLWRVLLSLLSISVPIDDITLVKYCTDTWEEDHIP